MISLLGRFLVFFSPSFLFPAFYSYIIDDGYCTIYLYSFSIVFLLGLPLAFLKLKEIKIKDAFTFVALSWIFVSFFGSFPYIFYGINPVDAFFESMSGFTTTGASVLKPEDLPESLLLWRALTQWFGGIGVIVLFLAVFPSFGKATPAVFYAEFPTVTLEKIKPKIKDVAIVLCELYIFFTIILFLILKFLGLETFDALTHALTTISTGGFSNYSESVAAFNNWKVELVVAFFMFIGGTNFALIYLILTKGVNPLKNLEFKVYLSAVVIGAVVLTLLNFNGNIIDSFRFSAFQAISAITNSGFTNYNFNEWSDASKLLMIILMFFGGCTGSTAGGLKAIRIYILVKYSFQKVLKILEPMAVRTLKIDDKIVDQETLDKITTLFILYILIYTISAFLISASGYDLTTAFSASAATLNLFGPGMEEVAEGYAALPPHLKLLLCLNMWFGRLEVFAVLILFIKKSW